MRGEPATGWRAHQLGRRLGTFTPGVDRKIDVRTTGECHCYEIKSEGGAWFNLTGMDIEFKPAGSR